MSAPRLSSCLLAAACGLALLGWRSATKRGDAIKARYKALLDEAWLYEDAVELAGRCAWHAGNVDPIAVPPHLIAPEHVEHFARGYGAEQDEDDARAAAWNAEMAS